MLKYIKFENFTAFHKLRVDFSPGVNVFIGENGTGKTHILKAAYAACSYVQSGKTFAQKINDVFYPSNKQIGRLVKRTNKSTSAALEIGQSTEENSIGLRLLFSNHIMKPEKVELSGAPNKWELQPIKSVYIPVKDMMANAPGFNALYEAREIHFEEVYVDIIRRAFLPPLKGPADKYRKTLLEKLQSIMEGKVISKNEEFFLRTSDGELEFTLLAEGIRKLGLLWMLIQNGTLSNGSVLFWDEPEANLNPKLLQSIVAILLELHRNGVQVFVATHDYVLLKEFDLQKAKGDRIRFHSLFRDLNTKEVEINSTDDYLDISPSAIDDTFGDLVVRDIERQMPRVASSPKK